MALKRSTACQLPRMPHLLRLFLTISNPGRSGVTRNAVTFSHIVPFSETGVRAITVNIPAKAAFVAYFFRRSRHNAIHHH